MGQLATAKTEDHGSMWECPLLYPLPTACPPAADLSSTQDGHGRPLEASALRAPLRLVLVSIKPNAQDCARGRLFYLLPTACPPAADLSSTQDGHGRPLQASDLRAPLRLVLL